MSVQRTRRDYRPGEGPMRGIVAAGVIVAGFWVAVLAVGGGALGWWS